MGVRAGTAGSWNSTCASMSKEQPDAGHETSILVVGLPPPALPSCRTGRLFHGSTKMHPICPDCGRQIERGRLFPGALYVSYTLSMVILGAMTYLGTLLLPDWNMGNLVLLAAVFYLPLMPWVFRQSRIIWIYYDYWAWPSKR